MYMKKPDFYLQNATYGLIIYIHITDVNDNSPEFEFDKYVIDLRADPIVGQVLDQVHVSHFYF
jgi:hypothetical protein